jgi:hypothetical protein
MLTMTLSVFAVGSVVGMSMAIRGGGAVVWSEHTDGFPFVKGVVTIFLSWIVSPISADPSLGCHNHQDTITILLNVTIVLIISSALILNDVI